MNVAKTAPPIVVFDTNTILSALLFNNQLSRLRALWQGGQCLPLASKATISELMRVLAYPKFKLSIIQQQSFLDEYLPYVKSMTKIQTIANKSICRDVNDVMFLELALTGKADYLVTGDKDLLVLQPDFQFTIITPSDFINGLF
jgi:uncharacterized protein